MFLFTFLATVFGRIAFTMGLAGLLFSVVAGSYEIYLATTGVKAQAVVTQLDRSCSLDGSTGGRSREEVDCRLAEQMKSAHRGEDLGLTERRRALIRYSMHVGEIHEQWIGLNRNNFGRPLTVGDTIIVRVDTQDPEDVRPVLTEEDIRAAVSVIGRSVMFFLTGLALIVAANLLSARAEAARH